MQSYTTFIETITNPQQKTRIQKVYTEEYYLLDTMWQEDQTVLKIAGSTKNVYTVTISPNKFWCDCPDMKSHAARHGVWCKHCCFVLLKVGKWFVPETFQTKTLSEECMQQISDRLHTVSGCEFISEELSHTFKQIHLSSSSTQGTTKFDVKERELTEEDECPICYDVLVQGEVKSCPECKQYIHYACMLKWLETKQTCVLCRSPEWKQFKQEERKKEGSQYIKL